MSTYLTKVRDCCGNVTVIAPCCRTLVVLEYEVFEDKITFTARGDCAADFSLYVDGAATALLTVNVPYNYFPIDCNNHDYKLVIDCEPTQESSTVSIQTECASTLDIVKYELQDLDANDDPEVYLEWELSNPCPLITSYDVMYRPLMGGFIIINVGLVTNYTIIDVPCGAVYEFVVVAHSVCNDVTSPSVYLFTTLCPCAFEPGFLSITSGTCLDRYIDLSFIPPLGALLTVDLYRKISTDPEAAYMFIGQWGANPFSDFGVVVGETYSYKAVISGMNCETVTITQLQTCIPDDCADSCTISVVSAGCCVTATFNVVNPCTDTIVKLYRDDGINPEVDLGIVVSPFNDCTIQPDTFYTYYLRTEGACITTECNDTITTDCFVVVTNTGDQDLGDIAQPSIWITTFDIFVPACCLPATAVWNTISPFINITTPNTPLVAGNNVCNVAGVINGAPAGAGVGSIFVTIAACDLCGDDDVIFTWSVL